MTVAALKRAFRFNIYAKNVTIINFSTVAIGKALLGMKQKFA